MNTSLFDTVFRDESGEIVIAQPPNLPLSLWIGASLLELVFSEGPINETLEIIAFASIMVWSLQELLDGVNYFRRGLGFFVLVSVVTSKILSVAT